MNVLINQSINQIESMQRDPLPLTRNQSKMVHTHTSPDLESELCGVWIWIPLPRAKAEIDKSPGCTLKSILPRAKA
jgi:hypothetical protein